VTTVEHQFLTFEGDPSEKKSITFWYDDLLNKCCICKGKRSGHSSTGEKHVD
jgi:hypothetical protein